MWWVGSVERQWGVGGPREQLEIPIPIGTERMNYLVGESNDTPWMPTIGRPTIGRPTISRRQISRSSVTYVTTDQGGI